MSDVFARGQHWGKFCCVRGDTETVEQTSVGASPPGLLYRGHTIAHLANVVWGNFLRRASPLDHMPSQTLHRPALSLFAHGALLPGESLGSYTLMTPSDSDSDSD